MAASRSPRAPRRPVRSPGNGRCASCTSQTHLPHGQDRHHRTWHAPTSLTPMTRITMGRRRCEGTLRSRSVLPLPACSRPLGTRGDLAANDSACSRFAGDMATPPPLLALEIEALTTQALWVRLRPDDSRIWTLEVSEVGTAGVLCRCVPWHGDPGHRSVCEVTDSSPVSFICGICENDVHRGPPVCDRARRASRESFPPLTGQCARAPGCWHARTGRGRRGGSERRQLPRGSIAVHPATNDDCARRVPEGARQPRLAPA